MDNRWNRFCEIFKKNYNEREEKVQIVFEQIFAVLFGYDPFDGEIDSHRTLHIGSTDRVIPDIIICDSNQKKDLFIVELKQLNLHFDKRFEEQLFSYMRLLSLRVGILICDAIYVYYLNNEKTTFLKIPVCESEENGEVFMDLFSKDSFCVETVEKVISQRERFFMDVQEIKNTLQDLDLKKVVKLYFVDKYDEKAIDEALTDVEILIREKSLPPVPPPTGGTNPTPIGKPSKEKIQDWVKRIFEYLFRNNLLTGQEIYYLHDLEYSKKTFGIAYALLVDNYQETEVSGHGRYWKKRIGKHYVCSQWWLEKDAEYEWNIKQWLSKVLSDFVSRGLDRYR